MSPLTVTWLPVVVPPPMPPVPVSGEADVPSEGLVLRSADATWPKALAADGETPDALSDASGVGPGAGTGVGAGPVVGPDPTWVCRSIGDSLGGFCWSAAAAAAAWPITPAT